MATSVDDELAAAFSGTVGVSFSADSTATQHPRMCMYKARDSKQSQWERRRRKLQLQREARRDYSDVARKLAEEDYANITLSDDEDDSSMDQSAPKARQQKRKPKKERYYSNQLMLSEWLDDVPEDLAENWLMVPCPVGKRTFVFASRGKTYHYTKSGFCVNCFQSALPGGSSNQTRNMHNYTILDCIYSEVHQTYWVLDCMCWHGHPVYDSDTEFRFFWLQAKLSEDPVLATGTKRNRVKFRALPSFPCDKQVLQNAMASPMPFEDELDGLLFYHKALHYTPGVTPLVGWLKPWMLPEVLSVPVPQVVMAKKPKGAQLRPPSTTTSPRGKAEESRMGTASMVVDDKPAGETSQRGVLRLPAGTLPSGKTDTATKGEMETDAVPTAMEADTHLGSEKPNDAQEGVETPLEATPPKQTPTSAKSGKRKGKKNRSKKGGGKGSQMESMDAER